ncbi:hypothetical protein FACS189438_0370 [Bacteroidia bacterium]|nr:hypothetical protein FACS189438_0370 [Bacteroidia bacterium]
MEKVDIEAGIARLRVALSKSKKENKRLSEKLERAKGKTVRLQKESKKRRSDQNVEQRIRTIHFEPVERHKYFEFVVRLSTQPYTRTNCGLHQVVEILHVVSEAFGGVLGTVPCCNTVGNWVKECGLKVYETAGRIVAWHPLYGDC